LKANKKSKMIYLLIGGLFLFVFFSWRKFLKQFNPLTIQSIVLNSKYKNLAPFIIAQAQVETGDFTSRLYKEANNLFGMRCAKVRPQKRVACFNNYAVYGTKEESVKDYLAWLDYANFPANIESVDSFVYELKKRRYFTDSYDNYNRLMKTFLT